MNIRNDIYNDTIIAENKRTILSFLLNLSFLYHVCSFFSPNPRNSIASAISYIERVADIVTGTINGMIDKILAKGFFPHLGLKPLAICASKVFLISVIYSGIYLKASCTI